MSTVCIMNLRKVAERIRAPRTLLLDRPMGALIGEPGDRAGQRSVVLAALQLLTRSAVEPGEISEYTTLGTAGP